MEILDAATQILVEDGYGRFSMRRVAEMLGLRISNVQYYFNGHGELLSALFDRSLQESVSAFDARQGQDTMEDAVSFVLEGQLHLDYCLMFWELWALAARDPDIDDVFKSYYAHYQNSIEQMLALRNPGLSTSVKKRRAIIVMSLFEGLSLFRGVEGRMDMPQRQFDKEIMKTVLQIADAD